MELHSFLQQLFTTGSITVEAALCEIDNDDATACTRLLRKIYEEDKLDMPAIAPEFSADAALWAAKYLYMCVLLTVIRDVEEPVVHEKLQGWGNEISASAIYSADLVLRHLPQVFQLAKGLAPADIMVTKMLETAAAWPFSSVGMPITEITNEKIIFADRSLSICYTDRIIKAKDKHRIQSERVQQGILQALGNYSAEIWPAFYEQISSKQTCITTTEHRLL